VACHHVNQPSHSQLGQVDTLIRYLLDELTRYEKNHQDALCPIPREGDKSFNGNHILTAPITAAETHELKMSFDCKLNHLSSKVKEVLDKLTLAPASSSYSSPSPPPSQPQAPISISTSVSSSQSLQLARGHQVTAASTIPTPVPMGSTSSSPLPRTIPTSQAPPPPTAVSAVLQQKRQLPSLALGSQTSHADQRHGVLL
jgi:hypothetical protein